MRKYLDSNEAEILKLTDSALHKLRSILDKEFEELELFPDFIEDTKD